MEISYLPRCANAKVATKDASAPATSHQCSSHAAQGIAFGIASNHRQHHHGPQAVLVFLFFFFPSFNSSL
jgi:hypothetical protein